jgi:transcriptional regulator with XRE-family HTH domain
MIDDLVGRTIGERIQIIRERTGKSRPVVAGLVGRSPEWLKAIERGRRQAPHLDMLIRLAEVLGVRDLAELTGDPNPDVNIGLQRRNGHPVVNAIREAIEEARLTVAAEPRPDASELSQRSAHAWRVWHKSPSPRADAGALLPGLIRDGRRAVRVLEGRERREAYAALAGAYALSEQVLAWVADSALLWLAADRCMDAAEQADDPETLAAAAWVLGNVWRATDREEDALLLAQDAVRLLEPRLNDGPDSTRALWGACQLHASITAARLGREGDALRALDNAGGMATRLPDAYAHPWTLFGVANSDLTGVTVQVDLHKGAHALEYATRVDPDSIPSLDRRARLWLETARAYAQKRDYTSTLHVLQRATSISEESMRCHPISRGLAGELVTSGGRLIESESRALAGRLGITV